MLVVQLGPRYQVLVPYLSVNFETGEGGRGGSLVLSKTNTCMISFYKFENNCNALSILYKWFTKVALDLHILYKWKKI